jgi:uncharacterized protein DUF6338
LVPTSTIALVAFFLLVIPGASYEILRSRSRLPREESPFLHISRILLSGTLITALVFVLLAAVHLIAVHLGTSTALADIPKFLLSGATYVAAHAWLVGKTLFLQIALSVLLAVIFSDLRSSGTSVIHEADAWHALGELLVKPRQTAFMSVRLKDGSEIEGYYFGASTELDPSKREIFLRAPLSFRGADDKPALAMDAGWQLMTISGSEIAYIATAYVTEGKESPPIRWRSEAIDWMRKNYLTWQAASIAILAVLAVAVFVR